LNHADTGRASDFFNSLLVLLSHKAREGDSLAA